MLKSLMQLDKILRGDATQLPSLEQGKIEIAASGLSMVLLLLGMVYGLCAGSTRKYKAEVKIICSS